MKQTMAENKLMTDALGYAESGFLDFPLHTVTGGKCTCGSRYCHSPAKHPRTVHGLALDHTPKRDLTRPLTVNDLQGSKMLSNFANSIFAIDESAKDKSLRYLKQIKARNSEVVYDAENVATCQIVKHDNFLLFEPLHFGSEREHLKTFNQEHRDELIQKIKELAASGNS